MKELEIKTLIRECSFEELDEDDRKLVEKAKEATRNAYAPFSGFHVGAALLLENGQVISGSNQENASYPSGLCAERTAVFYASSSYPGIAVKKIAVAAWTDPGQGKDRKEGFRKNPVTPCGGCRQALIEYEHLYGNIEIILYGSDKTLIIPSVGSLLPLGFVDF